MSFEKTAEIARRMKQDRVAHYGNDLNPELSDLRNFAVCVRASQEIMLLEADSGMDATRQICYCAAAMVPCDEVYLVADARFMHGESWEDLPDLEHGELQERWKAGDREGIEEGLMITRFPFLGNPSMLAYPYRREGTKLTWGPESSGGHLEGGAIPNLAAKGFAARKEHWPRMQAMIDMGAQLLRVPTEDKQYHIDRAIARVLSESEGVGRVIVLADESKYVDGKEL